MSLMLSAKNLWRLPTCKLIGGRLYVSGKISGNGHSNSKETYFGYTKVSQEEKAERVHDIFEGVAEKYDLMNDVMSGGIHRLWKDCFVSRLSPTPYSRYIDVAGGTGDITFRIISYILQKSGHPSDTVQSSDSSQLNQQESTANDGTGSFDDSLPYEIVVYDISQGMLDVGRRRAEELGHSSIEWVCGDAQALPFPDNHFDCYSIAYGMRNIVDIQKALQEAYRVLKPGGRFMCLEFSYVANPAIRWLYEKYSFQIIPVMGQVVAGDWKSYQYLVESIRKFPDQVTYKKMIEAAGFKEVMYENLTFGITAIHSGFKF